MLLQAATVVYSDQPLRLCCMFYGLCLINCHLCRFHVCLQFAIRKVEKEEEAGFCDVTSSKCNAAVHDLGQHYLHCD